MRGLFLLFLGRVGQKQALRRPKEEEGGTAMQEELNSLPVAATADHVEYCFGTSLQGGEKGLGPMSS